MLQIKQKILRNQADKLIRKQKNRKVAVKKIQKVAVLNNPSSKLSFDNLKYVQKTLGLSSNQFDIITFKDKRDNYNELRGLVISKDIFSAFGKIKSPEVIAFLNKEYDLLLDFTKMSNVYERYLSLSIHANCRIGYFTDEELYDVMLMVAQGNIKAYIDEAKRYLKIIGLL